MRNKFSIGMNMHNFGSTAYNEVHLKRNLDYCAELGINTIRFNNVSHTVAEREKVQYPVSFISHAFRGAESRYPIEEKLVFALVMASQKLGTYFQSHPIKVLTVQPIQKIIEGKNHSNRMTEWRNQLSDFGLEYEPRRAIKA